jgi:glycosyltransferase involved in cell wall biosynthesis
VSGIQRHALTYFGTAGVLLLALSGGLILMLIRDYNQDRVVDLGLAAVALLSYAMAQSMLVTAVTAYVATRRGYTPPPMPQIPKAKTVALIPAYNEAGRVGKVVEEARKYVDLVIVADDGSRDATAEEAQKAGALVVRHPTNMGKGAAVRTLIKAAIEAEAQRAVMLDADGQHDPRDIPKFLKALETADHVIGYRFNNTKMPPIRRLGYKALAAMHRLLIDDVKDPFNGYRAFSATALKKLDTEFDPSYGVEIEINKTLKHLKKTYVDTTITYGEKTSKQNFVTQGLNLAWTIAWVWLTTNPTTTATLGIMSMATSAALFIHTSIIFNTTRYIRLTYTALSLILETVAMILIAIAITTILTRK